MASKSKKKTPEESEKKKRAKTAATNPKAAAKSDKGKAKSAPAKASPAKSAPKKAAAKPAAKKAAPKPAAKKTTAREPDPKKPAVKKPAEKKASAPKKTAEKKASAAKKTGEKKATAKAAKAPSKPEKKTGGKILAPQAQSKAPAKKPAKSAKAVAEQRPPKSAEKMANRAVRQPSVAERDTRSGKEQVKRDQKAKAQPARKVASTKAGVMTLGMYAGIKVCDQPGPLPDRAPYSEKELLKLKDMLQKEREEALQSLRYLDNLAFSSTSVSGDRETPGYSTHPAEFASDYAAADTSLGLRNLAETRLAQVDEALQRMQDALYGVCVACGAKIGMERLKVKPFAVLCVPCRTNYEKNRSRGYSGME